GCPAAVIRPCRFLATPSSAPAAAWCWSPRSSLFPAARGEAGTAVTSRCVSTASPWNRRERSGRRNRIDKRSNGANGEERRGRVRVAGLRPARGRGRDRDHAPTARGLRLVPPNSPPPPPPAHPPPTTPA